MACKLCIFSHFVLFGLLCRESNVSALGAEKSRMDYQVSQTQMNAEELNALYEVMDAMAGNINWRLLHPNPCTEDLWPGLVCQRGDDGLLHVTRLDFGYKPNPSCTNNASIPLATTKLTFLQSLFIFECFTSTNTTIPAALEKLAPSLQELSLRANSALVGRIPLELARLSRLQLLSLSQNSLEGEIPVVFGKLSGLQHLDLSENLLQGQLPPELGDLRDLVILDLSVNSFTGSIPPSLGSLSMLKKLDCSSNALEGPLPSEFGNLKYLEFLAANNNFITGPLPASLSKLKLLQYLIIDNNPMKVPLPIFIGVLPSLMALSMSNSGYYGTIPDGIGKLGNLTVLSLERNNLTGSIPMGLGQLPKLYQLDLSQNSLSGPVPFSPDVVNKLGRNLDLSGNLALCSHWSYPENIPGGRLRLCSDAKYSTLMRSGSRGSLLQSPPASSFMRPEMSAAMSVCLVSTAIYLQGRPFVM